MKASTTALVVTCLAFAGCRDMPIVDPADSAALQVAPEPAAALETGQAARLSTICTAHHHQLSELQSERADRPADVRLSNAVAALEIIIANTCN